MNTNINVFEHEIAFSNLSDTVATISKRSVAIGNDDFFYVLGWTEDPNDSTR